MAPPLSIPALVAHLALAASGTAADTPTAAGTLEVGADGHAAFGLGDDGGFAHHLEVASHAAARLAAGAMPTLGYGVGLHVVSTIDSDRPGTRELLPDLALELDGADVPLLSSPRGLLRAPYDQRRVAMALGETEAGDDHETTMVAGRTELTQILQRGAGGVIDLRTGTTVMTLLRGCRAHGGDVTACVTLVELTGAETLREGDDAGVHHVAAFTVWPLAVSDVVLGRWRVAARAGFTSGAASGLAASGGDPPRASLSGLAYDLRAAAQLTDRTALDLHAARALVPSMDGALLVEDRGDAALTWSGDRVRLDGHAFAARGRALALGGAGFTLSRADVTGGADLTVTRAIDRWQLAATAGAARTYYPAPDGSAPAASLAATGSMSLRLDWKDALTAPRAASPGRASTPPADRPGPAS